MKIYFSSRLIAKGAVESIFPYFLDFLVARPGALVSLVPKNVEVLIRNNKRDLMQEALNLRILLDFG
jgi:hypothetical protein